MTSATSSPKSSWRWSTGFERAVGKKARCCATSSGASSPIPAKRTRFATRASVSPLRAVAAADADPVSGGSLFEGTRVCRQARRIHFRSLPQGPAEIVGDIRERAAALGRDPNSVQIYVGLPVVCGETDAAAQAKIEDYRKYISAEGTLALWSGYLGIDLASCNLDEPLSSIKINGIQTFVESFTRTDPTRNWTLRDAVELIGVEGHPRAPARSARCIRRS